MFRRVLLIAAMVGLGVWPFPRDEPALVAPVPVPEVLVAPTPAPAPEKPKTLPPIDDPFCGDTHRSLTFIERTQGERRWVEVLAGEEKLGTQDRRTAEPSLNEIEKWNALDDTERIESFRKAMRANPDDAVTAWFFVKAARHEADPEELLAAMQAFLKHFPVAEAQRLQARFEVARDVQKGNQRVSSGGVTLEYPPASLTASQARKLVSELDVTLDEAARYLDTPRRKRLSAVVYTDRSDLLAVTCAPTWAGGLYDGKLHLVASNHALGVEPRVMRHESVHAQLRELTSTGPLWFHEGVARAFEHSPPPKKAWTLMVKNRSWIPFSSLDGSLEAFADDDASLAYAQSLAMVEFLRECGGTTAISRAIASFKSGAKTPEVLAQVCQRGEVSGSDLLQFIEGRLSQ